MYKLICHYCEHENDVKRKYCEKCGKQLRKRKKFLLILLLIFILLLYFVLDSIIIQVPVEKIRYEEEPVYVVKEAEVQVPIEKKICEDKKYRYSTVGGNVDKLNDYVKPNLGLINLETGSGYFKVNFSYIHESKFPYSIYGGDNLITQYESGNISNDDADFKSINYRFFLDAQESITIRNLTFNPYPSRNYWAIANIEEPTFEYCSIKTEYINKIQNKTFAEYKKVKKTVIVKEKKSITQMFGINNFFEWIMLILLFILIIILIIKIKREKRYVNSK